MSNPPAKPPQNSANWRQWSTTPALWEKLRTLAAEKRYQPTPAEYKLWEHLRDRQIADAKFRRQHAIERFIVDFVCPSAKLVIEVDGPIHDYTPIEDAIRQEFLESQGYRVLRFTNERVLREIDKVLQEISSALRNDLDAGDSTSPPALLSEFGEEE